MEITSNSQETCRNIGSRKEKLCSFCCLVCLACLASPLLRMLWLSHSLSVYYSLFLTPGFLTRPKLYILGQNIALLAVTGMEFRVNTPLTDDSSSHLLIMQYISPLYSIISQLTSNVWEVFKYVLTSCSRDEHWCLLLQSGCVFPTLASFYMDQSAQQSSSPHLFIHPAMFPPQLKCHRFTSLCCFPGGLYSILSYSNYFKFGR